MMSDVVAAQRERVFVIRPIALHQLRLEAFLSGTLRGTEDAVEGPKAFAEKRKPDFKAR